MSNRKTATSQKPPRYPFGAIEAHQNMQKAIDDDRMQPLAVPSECTSTYVKGPGGGLAKVPSGVSPKDFHDDQVRKYVPPKAADGDSDDAAAAAVSGPHVPKQRYKDHCCAIFKQIDMYGITPGLVVQGHSTFKTWWGAFFSLLAIAAIGYYAVLKGNFYYFNHSTHFVTRLTVADAHGVDEAVVIHTLESQDVGVALEFAVSPTRADYATWTPDQYEADVKDFARYLNFVIETVETDSVTGAEQPFEPTQPDGVIANIEWQGGSHGGARTHIDGGQLRVRAEAYTSSMPIKPTAEPAGEEKPPADTRRLQDADSSADADGTAEEAAPAPDADEVVPPPVNRVTSRLHIRPSLEALEVDVLAKYSRQPSIFYQEMSVYSAATYEEYLRREAEFANQPFQELTTVRKLVYDAFVERAGNYLITLVLDDQLLALNDEGESRYVPRRQRLFTRRVAPSAPAVRRNEVRLALHQLDYDERLQWPSTSWLFRGPEADIPYDKPAQTFFVADRESSADTWPRAFKNAYPGSTPPFPPSLFTLEFSLNPVALVHQQQTFKHWIGDLLADCGGFLVFTTLFFGLFCQGVPLRLYQAQVLRDAYRLKFNKILKGIKLNKSERHLKHKKQLKMRKEREAELAKEQEMAALAAQTDAEPEQAEVEEEKQQESEDLDNTEEREEEKNELAREAQELKDFEADMAQLEVEGGGREEASSCDRQSQIELQMVDIYEGGGNDDKESPITPRTPRDSQMEGKSARSDAKSPLLSKRDTKSKDRSQLDKSKTREKKGSKDGSENQSRMDQSRSNKSKTSKKSLRSRDKSKSNDLEMGSQRPRDKSATAKPDSKQLESDHDMIDDAQSQKSKTSKKDKDRSEKPHDTSKQSKQSKKSKNADKDTPADRASTPKPPSGEAPKEKDKEKDKEKEDDKSPPGKDQNKATAKGSPQKSPEKDSPTKEPARAAAPKDAKGLWQALAKPAATPDAAANTSRQSGKPKEDKNKDKKDPDEKGSHQERRSNQSETKSKTGDEKDKASADVPDVGISPGGPAGDDDGDDCATKAGDEGDMETHAELTPAGKGKKPKKHKPFDYVDVSSFQVVRLFLTPRCCYTWYQQALARLMKKAVGKMSRELELANLLKRVRDAHNLTSSFELSEMFHGMHRKYKNSYSNVVNVSLDTQGSLEQEYALPLPPADVPYQRAKLKRYKAGPGGLVQSQMVIEPFDFDRETLAVIAKAVYKKLKGDEQLIAAAEAALAREQKAERKTYAAFHSDFDRLEKKFEMREARTKQTPDMVVGETPQLKLTRSAYAGATRSEQYKMEASRAEDKFAAISRGNSALDMTGFSKMPAKVNQEEVKKQVDYALRKNILHKFGKYSANTGAASGGGTANAPSSRAQRYQESKRMNESKGSLASGRPSSSKSQSLQRR